MSKKYIMLFNHLGDDEQEDAMLMDLIRFFPEVKILEETVVKDEFSYLKMQGSSSWIPEDQFLAVYIFINMYPNDYCKENTEIIDGFIYENTIQNVIAHMNRHLEDEKFVRWF